MDIKQHAPDQPIDQRKKLKGKRNQKMSWDKWKWKHNIPKLMGDIRGIIKREDYIGNTYIKNEERSQINNLTLDLMELEE